MISYTAPASVANSNQPNGPTLTKDVFLGGPMGAQIFCSLTNLNGSLGGLFFYGCDYHNSCIRIHTSTCRDPYELVGPTS